jgi:hypothetical protein
MARLGYIEWNSADELPDGSDPTPFSDPEVRARMAALIVRAAQNCAWPADFSLGIRPADGRDDVP